MIHFDAATHTYTNHWGDVYTSSTQLVSRFKQPFDTVPIATRYAAKHGQTPAFWIAKWAEKRDTACDRGTAFHQQKEQMILAAQQHALFGTLHVVQRESVERIEQLPDGIHVELLLWDHDAQLAGQADLVAIETDPATGARWFDLDDHKTNGRIDRESYYHWRAGHRMMLPPLAHLMDCNWQHYELQLSIYGWMLERAGYLPRRLQFTHYGPDESGAPSQPQPYPLEFRRAEVEAMLGAGKWL